VGADPRAGGEILEGLGDEHFGWLGDRADASADGDGETDDVVAVEFDLAGVQSGPHLDSQVGGAFGDGLR